MVQSISISDNVYEHAFDAAACPRAKLEHLSREKLASFLRLAWFHRKYALSANTPMREALTHLNLLDGEQPNHAAVMLFGEDPQRFLYSSMVECLHFVGMEFHHPIHSRQVYQGTVFELIDQTVRFVMSRLDTTIGTRALSTAAPVTHEIPPDAVAEAICNAIVHRNYASKASVQVMLFVDRLEVWNPGELPPPLTPKKLHQAHLSILRNPLIAEPLFLARYIESSGTGTLDMIRLCREAGLKPPEFRQDAGQFIQVLWRPKPAVTVQAVGYTVNRHHTSRQRQRIQKQPIISA